jgi:1,2-diacylglycerol 3-alpha-glucosyltransferase
LQEGKLRVAIFSDSALPILNGVSVSIQALVSELRNQGHSVTVFTASHFQYKDPDPNTYRFFAVETPWTKNYPLAMPPFYGMLRQFRKQRFDLIHTHTPFTIGFIGLRWAESHGIPIVSTYHTLYDRYAHYIPFFPRRYVRFKIAKHTNFYYNKVDHVITPSHASYRWLRRHSVKSPISVIPTGTPPRLLLNRAEVRHQLGMAPEHRVMLYVGRIAKEKNLRTLFEMAAIAFRQEPALRLLLVGDGPYRGQCAQMARDLGIGDRVTFAGFVPRDQVDQYYAASDLFVFSSITETQGLVVQEAMSYGLPAVAVAGGGASAGIQNGVNGFIVKNDAQPFAAKVLQIVSDPLLYEALSHGASTSVRSYTAQQMAEAVLGVYNQVLQRHGNAEPRRAVPA